MTKWNPESPFLETPNFFRQNEGPVLISSGKLETPWVNSETPFIRDEYETHTQRSTEINAIAEFLTDVRDEAFETSVNALIAKARGHLADRYDGEYEAPNVQVVQATRELEQFFLPLQTEMENLLDRMATGLDKQDLKAISKTDLDTLLGQYAPSRSLNDPEFDNFLGDLFNSNYSRG